MTSWRTCDLLGSAVVGAAPVAEHARRHAHAADVRAGDAARAAPVPRDVVGRLVADAVGAVGPVGVEVRLGAAAGGGAVLVGVARARPGAVAAAAEALVAVDVV